MSSKDLMTVAATKENKACETLALYESRGLGGSVGFGVRPAILVVDATLGFTDPASPLGGDYMPEVAAISRLLARARALHLPIVFSTVVYEPDMAEAGIFARKIPTLACLQRGSAWVDVDPRLYRQPTEVLLEKKFASCFFGTHLASLLSYKSIDTLIVTGFTTSGCVRASVVDGLQHGMRVIVPRECTGDRTAGPHEASLLDIQAKYGDVLSLDSVLAKLTPAV